MQFQGKLINQTWENGKKNLVSGPMLAHIWVPKIVFVDFTSTRCYKLLQAIIVRNFKEN